MIDSWSTALVTGASSGIGRAITRQLVAEGCDVAAVARDKARLDHLAAEAESKPGSIEVLPTDLAESQQLATVEARLADTSRPIDLLVNNAGFGTYGRFADLPIDDEEREIKVNVVAVVRLAHAALGAMRQRGRGAILNVSSVSGLQATPGNATYGATKAYVASFSEALHEETRGSGVTVTALLPGFTRTEFAERNGVEGRPIPDIAWMSAEEVARQALAATRAGRAWLIPGVFNKVTTGAAAPIPRSLRRRLAARLAKGVNN